MSRGVPFAAVVRSEATKFAATRSTWWCTALFVLLVGGAGWLAAATTQAAPSADVAVSSALTGFGVGQVPLVVVGVLAISAEFSTGLALASLVAVPRRSRLLLATSVVVVLWAVLLAAVLAAGCVLAARTLTAVPGGVPVTDPGVLRQLAIAGTELTVRISRLLPAFRVGEDAFLTVATSWQTGLVVAGAWAGAAWVLGAVLLERRDV